MTSYSLEMWHLHKSPFPPITHSHWLIDLLTDSPTLPSKHTIRYRVFINYCVFPYNFVIFLNSARFAAALVFYLPGVCTHTDTERKQRKARVQNILKSLKKQYLMNTLLLFFSYLDFITVPSFYYIY